MKFEFKVKKDTIIQYLNELENRVNSVHLRDKYLELMAGDIVEMVDEVVPKMNPNLRYSGLNEDFWDKKHEDDFSSLTILYTVFTGEMQCEPDDIEVWWEFGKYHKGGYGDILGRDYAYYQEFGEDKFAPNSKVKAHTFEGHHYLESGILDSPDIVEYWAGEYLLKVLYGK